MAGDSIEREVQLVDGPHDGESRVINDDTVRFIVAIDPEWDHIYEPMEYDQRKFAYVSSLAVRAKEGKTDI